MSDSKQSSTGSVPQTQAQTDLASQASQPQNTFIPAPPPAVSGFIRYFDDPNHDGEAVARSHLALSEYRASLRSEMETEGYPFRVRSAHQTGLPAQMSGLLDRAVVDEVGGEFRDPADAAYVAGQWLNDPRVSPILSGLDRDVALNRPLWSEPEVLLMPSSGSDYTNAHVAFHQMHGEIPVHGGRLVVHLTDGSRRVAASSSYMPLIEDLTGLDLPQNFEAEKPGAIELARQALLDMLPPPDGLPLYWEALDPWLDGAKGPDQWTDEQTHLVELLALSLAYLHDIDQEGADYLVGLARGGELAPLLGLLGKRHPADPEDRPKLSVVPYRGSELFIFPFGGSYYLATQIEYLPPRPRTPYRVFIDVQGWNVLGEPDPLASFHPPIEIFESSDQALNLSSTPLMGALGDRQTPLDALAAGLDQFATISHPLQTHGSDQEVVNVAYHALRIFNHFKGLLGGDASRIIGYKYPDPAEGPNTQNRGIHLRVKRPGPTYQVKVFLEDSTNPKEICLQTDTLQAGSFVGLATDYPPGNPRKVYAPSLDPEVIYHEMTHALLWMIQRAPFALHGNSVPFWRALWEGYADYFGRSLGARRDTSANTTGENRWAASAYRDYGSDKAMAPKGPFQDDRDRLAFPNLYSAPDSDPNSHAVYRMGEIWARALWDVRTELNDADAADRLVLNAYMHLHGWVANFEGAAEAIILELSRSGAALEAIGRIKGKFAARRIFAESGTQALVEGKEKNVPNSSLILVGSDAGVAQFTGTPGTQWQHIKDLDVVALTANGLTANLNPVPPNARETVYAATELDIDNLVAGSGIYRNASPPNAGGWQKLAQSLPDGSLPLCLAEDRGMLFVGTPSGVWQLDAGNPGAGWVHWTPGALNTFGDLVLHLVPAVVREKNTLVERHLLLAATYDRGGRLTVLPTPPNRTPGPWMRMVTDLPQPSGSARMTCVALVGDTVYIGTLAHGIWRRRQVQYSPGLGLVGGAWVNMPHHPAMTGKAITCLAYAPATDQLLAGTNDGVFRHNRAANGSWRPAGPPGTMVRQILAAGGALYLATYNSGLCKGTLSGAGNINWLAPFPPPPEQS
jgi:hypothetical protein